MFVRDMDLRDFDRLADGLPLFGDAQLAIDATLMSAIKRDRTAIAGAATSDGAPLSAARRRKVRTCRELSGEEDVAWLSWVAKWQDDGFPKLVNLTALSRAKLRLKSSARVPRLGDADGETCWGRTRWWSSWHRRWRHLVARTMLQQLSEAVERRRPPVNTRSRPGLVASASLTSCQN